MENKIIVAEVAKSWKNGDTHGLLVSQRFEAVIAVNLERGYKLKDWKMYSHLVDGIFTETIIAIFEKEEAEPATTELMKWVRENWIVGTGDQWRSQKDHTVLKSDSDVLKDFINQPKLK